jgi:hypothetical protein
MLRRSLLLAIAAGMIPAAVCSAAAASAAPTVRATGASADIAAHAGATKVSGYLSAVAAISGSDAWAVGDSTSGSTFYPLTMRWTGTAWARVASPKLADGGLSAVAIASAKSAWAVGTVNSLTTGEPQSLILHWNGTAWTQVASPNPSSDVSLSGVATAPGGKAWAVGSYYTKAKSHSLILRWNGTAWTRVASPSPGSQQRLSDADPEVERPLLEARSEPQPGLRRLLPPGRRCDLRAQRLGGRIDHRLRVRIRRADDPALEWQGVEVGARAQPHWRGGALRGRSDLRTQRLRGRQRADEDLPVPQLLHPPLEREDLEEGGQPQPGPEAEQQPERNSSRVLTLRAGCRLDPQRALERQGLEVAPVRAGVRSVRSAHG